MRFVFVFAAILIASATGAAKAASVDFDGETYEVHLENLKRAHLDR